MAETARGGRFVLLEHAWEGVHWDFMLEAGGGLRTWAIDAPIIPGVDLPARLLPDHRLDYLDYEGPISGDRGSVRRVALGTFRTIVWGADQIRVRLEGDQLVGEVLLYPSAGGSASDSSAGSTIWTFRLGNVD